MTKKNFPTIDIHKLCDIGQQEVLISRFSDYFDQHYKNLAHPHRHNFYHLVYFTEGKGSHTIDFTRFEMKPGQIYFMNPSQVHSWDFEGVVDGFLVNFTGSFFHSFLLQADYLESFSFFKGITPDNVLNLSEETDRVIRPVFEEILKESQLRNVYSRDLVRVKLLEVFLLIEQEVAGNRRDKIITHQNDTVLKNFQRLIEMHFLELHLPSEYADLLAITPNHLNALCKEHLGMKAGELIRNRILLEAKRLLVNLELSVSQVGYALNFSDSSYFTRFFKKKTGQTPEEFRKEHRY